LNLTEYVRIIARRGWIMVILAIIAGGTAFVLTRQQDPVYRATQIAVIEPSRADLGLASATQQLLNSQVVIIDSVGVAEQIVNDLELPLLPAELKGMVTIAADQFRLVIRIDVESENPNLAFDIAAAWGRELQEYRDERNAEARREDRIFAALPEPPSVGQIAPRPRIFGIAGGILGLLVGGVVIFVLEYLESSIVRRQEDLERSEVPVLASIPGFDG